MTVAELIAKLIQYDPETEVLAVDVPEYDYQGDTGEPVIDVKQNKKDVAYLLIRA